ncbi:uncharacterized protein MELLADRAFT_112648 [Melampsora larici-populina 98AG31]|uniref:CxC1-like cysteine cluster associated with KDZ transposases domain-containing protein n=1 Tax=Melampsora larici-populina (strain 98AG31 / pathotype 3-4-7) TaxID=747676 RepID=F4S755_MELLP|nr:uncharacterized protein MELLADRAFT_112648 [Melampsora larici-populina 98AG31]EGF99526.1 hypothetical protein MELLADRAFT_112648 [Melampsora larici-populina 98AG31]
MGRKSKKLCSNLDNANKEPARRRIKRDAAAEQQYEQEVEQGAQFLAGILPGNNNNEIPIPNPHNNPKDVHGDLDLNMNDINPEFIPFPNDPPLGNVEDQLQPEANDVIAQFVARHREIRYANDREQLRKHWEAIEKHLTAAYLESQTNTLNWTSKQSYLDDASNLLYTISMSQPTLTISLQRRPICVKAGYLPASPQQPWTAFFIPLLQMYQNLWQTSVSAATSWIEGYMNFLDGRSAKEDTARGSDATRRRDLRQPFSSTANIYSRIIVLAKSVLHLGLQLATTDLWAKTIAKHNDPNQAPLQLDEEDLNSLLDDFPDLRVAILYDIGCQLDKHIRKHTAEWLHRKLQNTISTIKAARETLNKWLKVPNPHRPGAMYTEAFFLAQWDSERKHNIATSKDIKTCQMLALGRLLCLEDRMYQVWDEDTQQELRAFDRLQRFQDLATQITEQRRKVGTSEILRALSEAGRDRFLKVWFAKTEVRTRFLALRAEQRPLDPENRVGGSSRLGRCHYHH